MKLHKKKCEPIDNPSDRTWTVQINRLVEYQRYKELTGTFKELER